jgi:fibronectin-binding autotransporter adhesin
MQSSPAFAKSAKGSDVSWRIQGMACRAVAGLALWLGLGELPQSAQAATIVWENTGTAFATGGNWVGGTAPANDTTTDIGSFQSATVSFNPQLTGSRSIAGLVFTSGTGAWTFTGNSGTRVLTLGAAGITNNSSNTQTFSGGALRLSLGANSTFDGETGSLAFAANMAGLYLNSYNLTLDGSSTTNTIAEAMSGTGGSITKVGSGTWTLSGANTYTGATNIGTAGGANAGTLVLGANNVLPGTTVNIYAGTLDINTRTDTIGALTLGGGASGTAANITGTTGTLTLGGNVTYSASNNPNGASIAANLSLGGANRTFTVGDSTAAANDLSISGVISNGSGNRGITKLGTGTLALSGTNTYTGVTTITAGTLSVGTIGNGGVAGNLGQASNAANRIVLNGGTLQYTGATGSTNRRFTLGTSGGTLDASGSGALTFSNAAAVTLSGTNTARTLTLTGANTDANTLTGILGNNGSGATTLTKSGTGTWVLGGANTYTGGTNLNGGTLRISSDGNLGGTSGPVTFNGGTLETTATLTLNAARVVTIGSGGGTFDVNNGTTLTYNGVLTGSGILNKDDTGTFITGGASGNTHTGAINVNAGVFEIAKTAYVGGIDNAADVAVASGATLRFNGGALFTQETIGSLSGAGTVTNVGAAAVNLVYGNNSSTTFSGILTDGTNALNLVKNGTGTFTLSGNNSFDGTTLINAGVLNIQTNTALGTSVGATSVTANNAALELQNGLTVTGEALSLTGTGISNNGALRSLSGNNTWTGNVTLTGATEIQTDADSLTLSGSVTSANLGLSVDGAGNTTLGGVVGLGTGGLTKDGSGTLTLSGANTYTGTTTVNAGTVLATNNSSLGGASGAVTVAAGATLALGGGTTITKTAMLNLAGDGVSAGAGALQAAGTTGQTSQWAGDITLTGNTTITAADNLLILGDDLNFDNTINLGSYTLTLNTTSGTGVTPTYLPYAPYILDPTNIYITSVITGSGGLTKTGDGTVNLISFPSNSYTGDTVITGGKLIVDGAGNAPVVSSSQVYVGNASSPGAANSVVLQLGQLASSPAANNLVGTYNNLTNLASTSLTVYADGLFNMNGGSNALVNLTLQGGRVTGDNLAYNPLLTVTGGITTLASDQTALIEELNLGMSANAFAFAIADGTTASGIDLQIDAIVQNGIGFTAGNAATSFAKTGDGTLVLTANNVYQGVTDIQQGILNIQSNTALGQVGPFLGSLDNGTVVQSGAQLQLEGGLTISTETLTLNGTGIGNTGALLNLAGDNTYNGFVRLESDSRINAEAGTTLDIANTGGVNATIMNGTAAGRNLTVGGAGDTEINGAIGAFVNTITKDGTGTLTLAGNNAYTGATNVTSGAVKVTHNSGLAGSGATVTSGAALQFAQDAGGNNINAVAVNATIAGTGLANGGAIQNLNGTNSYAGAITLSADARITANSGSALTLSGNVNGAGYDLEAGGQGNTTYSGVISGTGTTFTKTDSGTVTFSGAGANTFTGALTVNEGTLNLNKTAGVNAVGTSNTVIIGDTVGAASSANLVLQANNQMPNTTDVTINSDGRLAMGTFSDEISQLAGTGLLDLGTTGLLTIGGDNSSSVFDGTITGTGTLEKSGTGSLTFNSDISYDGTLELGGGTLVLNDMLLSVDTLTITANSTIDFGAVGNSYLFTETLSFLNTSVTLNIINWSFGVDAFYATFWPGATYDLLDNAGATPMSQITFDGWAPNNTGWDSYDDQIYPNVPEPSTYGALLMASALAAFGYNRWRKRRAAKQAGPR